MKLAQQRQDSLTKPAGSLAIEDYDALAIAIAGAALTIWLGIRGYTVPGMEEMAAQFNLPGRIYPQATVLSTLLGPSVVFLFSVLAAVYPAWRLHRLHPVEAMHGDLGMVSQDDVFLALSYSGETDELNLLLPSIRNIGCKVIAFTGNRHSTLAQHSDIVIDVAVNREACPLGLAPTASSTASTWRAMRSGYSKGCRATVANLS